MALDLWLWYYTDPITTKRLKTRYRCSEADARATYGEDVERVPGSLEMRQVEGEKIQPGYMSKKPGT